MAGLNSDTPGPDTAVVRFALGFVLGDLLLQQLPWLPAPIGWVLVLLVMAVPAYFKAWTLTGLVLGFGWAGLIGALALEDGRLTQPVRSEWLVEGHVLDIPDQLERGQRFDFGVDRVLAPPTERWPSKLRISGYDALPPVRAGDHWRLKLSLRPPRGMSNPGGFDYEQWLFAAHIGGVGYAQAAPDTVAISGPVTLADRVGRLRQSIFERLQSVLGDIPVAGLLTALIMGNESGISADQWSVLRRTGTAHLVAISGSHIGLMAGLLFFLTQRLAVWLPARRLAPPQIAAMVGLIGALLYSALANFSIPTQRALIMIAVAMLAIVLKRQSRVVHVLAVALVAVLIVQPMAVLAAGFWLSFGAVGVILFAIEGRVHAPGAFRLLWRINLFTAVALAPLLLLFFRQVSLVAPVANLFAVPILGTLLIPLSLLGVLLLWIAEPAGVAVLHLCAAILTTVWGWLDALAALPWAQWTHSAVPVGSLLLAGVGTLLLLAPRGIPRRGLGGLMLLPALLHQPPRPEIGGVRLTLLDVGQGLSAVVETRHRTLVYDTGARLSASFDMGSAVLVPYLQARGIRQVDALVVSHGDNDHSGGVLSLQAALPIAGGYSSVPDRWPSLGLTACHAGQVWDWDGVRFEMLAPIEPARKANDNSCVLLIRAGGRHVMLTGDIEAEGERYLVEHASESLAAEVLVAPHHGSRSSSTQRFIEQVHPRQVLVPAGYLNAYGFPAAEVLARYRALGGEPITTADGGAVTLEITAHGEISSPHAYRQQARRYWMTP